MKIQDVKTSKGITGGVLILLIGLVVFTTALAGSITGFSIFTGKIISPPAQNLLNGPSKQIISNNRIFGTFDTVQITKGCNLLNLSASAGRFLPNSAILPSIRNANDYCAAKGYSFCNFLTTSSTSSPSPLMRDCASSVTCTQNGYCGYYLTTNSSAVITCCNN
ncbi:MAG: hypothetical protein WC595_02860 [Candidatus Nanoarchaeia archaeon]